MYKTKKLYRENVYLLTCKSEIIFVEGNKIVLDKTIFAPSGGGQSSDIGNICVNSHVSYEVIDVIEKANIIYHIVNDHNLKVGDEVTCHLDWNHRFNNMQRHSGEHILSGVWHRHFQGVNKGFHMGDDYMTMDICLANSPYDTIDSVMATEAEFFANDIIYQNLPITIDTFADISETSKMPLRKPISVAAGESSEITVVSIGEADCVACCGTHVMRSGEVGLIKIYKVEKNKGMFRVYFEAGKRAMSDYSTKHQIISTLGNKFSASPLELVDSIGKLEEKYDALVKRQHNLVDTIIGYRKEIIKECILSVNSEYKEKSSTTQNLNTEDKIYPLFFEYDDLTTKELQKLGQDIAPLSDMPLLICHKMTNTLLLFSNGIIDCSKLVKDFAATFGGKGGGKITSSQVKFSRRADLLDFANAVRQQSCW